MRTPFNPWAQLLDIIFGRINPKPHAEEDSSLPSRSGEEIVASHQENIVGQVNAGDGNIQLQLNNSNAGDIVITTTGSGVAQKPRLKPIPINGCIDHFPNLLNRTEVIKTTITTLKSGQSMEVNGRPGMGKTVFLRYLTNHAFDDFTKVFPHGVIHHSIRPHQKDLLKEIFDKLYDDPRPPSERNLRTDSKIGNYLKEIKALIALDDAEHAQDQVDLLKGAAKNCTFLLASTKPLLRGEAPFSNLDVLPLNAAVTLVEREVNRNLSRHNTPLSTEERSAAEDICYTLGGHPLLIIQVMSLAQKEGLSLMEIARQMPEVFDEEMLVARILRRLSSAEIKILAVLAVLKEASTDEELLAEVTEEPEASTLLKRLKQRGLVKSNSPRYSLAAPFVGQALAQTVDLTTTADQTLAYFTTWAREQQSAPDRVLEEADAIMQLIEWGLQAERWSAVLRLVRAVEGALALGLRWGAWEQVLQWGLQAARALGDQVGIAWALHQLGTRALCLGVESTAKLFLRQALRLREALGDQIGAEVTRHNLGLLIPLVAPPGSESTPGTTTSTTQSGGTSQGVFPPLDEILLLPQLLKIAALSLPVILTAIGALSIWYAWTRYGPESPASTPQPIADVSTVTPTATATPQVIVELPDTPTSTPPPTILPPVDTPTPTGTPIPPPTSTNVPVPTNTPITAPSNTPVTAPTNTPVTAPSNTPVTAPSNTPVTPPTHTPTHTPTPTSPPTTPVASVSPSQIDFGEQLVNTVSATQVVTVTNTGSAPLLINQAILFLSNSEYNIVANGCKGISVAPDSSCKISLNFAPKSEGVHSDILLISDNAADSPQSVLLNGIGIAPVIEATPDKLGFEPQLVNTISLTKLVTVTNIGSAPTSNLTYTLTGNNPNDFLIVSDTIVGNICPPNLNPDELCHLGVQFNPQDIGLRSATLVITDVAASQPETVILTGTGISPPEAFIVQACYDTNADGDCADETNQMLPAGVEACLNDDTNCQPLSASPPFTATFEALEPGTYSPFLRFTGPAQGLYPTTPRPSIDLAAGETRTVSLGAVYPFIPTGVAVHQPSNKVYATFLGTIIDNVPEFNPFVAVIDGQTDEVLHTIPITIDQPVNLSSIFFLGDIAISGDRVYVGWSSVSNEPIDQGQIFVIDTNSDILIANLELPPPFVPIAPVVNPVTGWVHFLDPGGNRLIIIDDLDIVDTPLLNALQPDSGFFPFDAVVANSLVGYNFVTSPLSSLDADGNDTFQLRGVNSVIPFDVQSTKLELSGDDFAGPIGVPYAIGLWQNEGDEDSRLFMTYAPFNGESVSQNPNNLLVYSFSNLDPTLPLLHRKDIAIRGDLAAFGLTHNLAKNHMLGTYLAFPDSDGVAAQSNGNGEFSTETRYATRVVTPPVNNEGPCLLGSTRGGIYAANINGDVLDVEDGAVTPNVWRWPEVVVGTPPLVSDSLRWKNPYQLAVNPNNDKVYVTDLCWNDSPERGRPSGGAVLIFNDSRTDDPPKPTIHIEPEELVFDSVATDDSKILTATVTNEGPGVGEIYTAYLIDENGDFSKDFNIITENCTILTSLTEGASCIITVRFAPQLVGNHEATLIVTSNGLNNPHRVPASGIGTAPPGTLIVNACHDINANRRCDDTTAEPLPAGVEACLDDDSNCQPVPATFELPPGVYTPTLRFTGESQGFYPTSRISTTLKSREVKTLDLGAVYPIAPTGIAVDEERNKIYAAFLGPLVTGEGEFDLYPYPFIAVIDGETDEVLHTISMGIELLDVFQSEPPLPGGIAVSNDRVYVGWGIIEDTSTDFFGGQISIIDANTDIIIEEHRLLNLFPAAPAVNPVSGSVHFIDFRENKLIVVDGVDVEAPPTIVDLLLPRFEFDGFSPFDVVVANSLDGYNFVTSPNLARDNQEVLSYQLRGINSITSSTGINVTKLETAGQDGVMPIGAPYGIGLWQNEGDEDSRLFMTYAPSGREGDLENPNNLLVYSFSNDNPTQPLLFRHGIEINGNFATFGLTYNPRANHMLGTYLGPDGLNIFCDNQDRGGTYAVDFNGNILTEGADAPDIWKLPRIVVGNPPLTSDTLEWESPFEMAINHETGKVYVTDLCWNSFREGGQFGGGAVLVFTDTVTSNLPPPMIRLEPEEVIFNTVAISNTETQSVTVTNDGPGTLEVYAVYLVDKSGDFSGNFTDAFTIGDENCSQQSGVENLPEGESCTIDISFTPTTQIDFNATLIIASNAEGSPHRVPLSGMGVGVPIISADPDSIDFGDIGVGIESEPQSVTIRNVGSAQLNIIGVSLTGNNPGDFIFSNNCTTLAPNESCTISIRFKPKGGGERLANLTINNSNNIPAFDVFLRGAGFIIG